uniref:Uncharacterized protein n=1 Tax=Haemonchus contortus TaxID=6289 RepID=W6NXN2_HAECO
MKALLFAFLLFVSLSTVETKRGNDDEIAKYPSATTPGYMRKGSTHHQGSVIGEIIPTWPTVTTPRTRVNAWPTTTTPGYK